ncbi:T-cell receptor-associated transmembrane adapter 1 isoform X2 [Crotalus tigris]|uniref:T-cell receptor-associated transmembrane adapter 1-like isoform X2 n=1 Tax=Crotalus tigris TaxID=88082 RepID=UPI00192F841B|nr:T-cell receptor-associated transmembrane adapter 1-like isoform X2 [Crotalus tigris]XP_039220948.1 T-cell receptor-associated transmembrane adapter 1 isoform X2 [Crotalus tigris]
MEANQCTICWIPLSFVTVIMIISLLKNISYFLKNKKQKGEICEDYNECNPSNEEFHAEAYPVYDNLNPYHQEMLNESCYEKMNVHSPRSTTDVQIAERQMCYASLDHSVRRKHKIQPKKKYPTLEMGENQLTRNTTTLSCIYLNSEQLSAENKLTENTSHVDSFREFGLKHKANDVMF